MVKSLELVDFKVGGKNSFSFENRVSVLDCGIGASRTLAFDALRLLFKATRERDASCFPEEWIGRCAPARISVSLATFEHPDLSYSVEMVRGADGTRILSERVSAGEEDALVRSGGFYRAGARSRGRRPVGDGCFSIAEAAKDLPASNPLNRLRSEMRDLWLVAPDAYRMGSCISQDASGAADDSAFARLAAYIALRAGSDPKVRDSMTAFLGRLGSAGITGMSVKPGAGDAGASLFVRHRNDLDEAGVPFGSLDNSEKMLFLAAFVCSVNESSSPLSVVWDSPSNWLGDRGGEIVVKMLRRSFARRGQLVMIA